MRLLKNRSVKYELFTSTLPLLNQVNGKNTTKSAVSLISKNSLDNSTDHLVGLEKIIFSDTINNAFTTLTDYIRTNIDFIAADFFNFHYDSGCYLPIILPDDPSLKAYINNLNNEGILDWIFESGQPQFIPDYQKYLRSTAKTGYLIFPLTRGNKNSLFIVNTSFSSNIDNKLTILSLVVNISFNRINLLIKEHELKNALNEIQNVQSRLRNDVRFSAIGELTNEIVEEILNPLQVISYHTEIEDSNPSSKNEVFRSIRIQVDKINEAIKRILKFSELNTEGQKLYPCNLNNQLKSFFEITFPESRGANIEVILDLDDTIPEIISNSDYLNQLFVLIINLIKSSGKKKEGLYIYTRYSDDKIITRFIFSGGIQNQQDQEKNKMSENNIKLLKHLVNKHEGSFDINSNNENGTIIILSFPFKRKNRV